MSVAEDKDFIPLWKVVYMHLPNKVEKEGGFSDPKNWKVVFRFFRAGP